PVGVVGPALHRALVTVSTAEHRRLDHWLPRTASHIALAAREIFLGLAVELLLAAHRAEVIGLALVRGLRRSLGRLHGHLADGINSHRLPPSILTVASQWVSSPANVPGRQRFKRRLLVTTDTDENAIAAPARIGESSTPASGYRTPAATGMSRML